MALPDAAPLLRKRGRTTLVVRLLDLERSALGTRQTRKTRWLVRLREVRCALPQYYWRQYCALPPRRGRMTEGEGALPHYAKGQRSGRVVLYPARYSILALPRERRRGRALYPRENRYPIQTLTPRGSSPLCPVRPKARSPVDSAGRSSPHDGTTAPLPRGSASRPLYPPHVGVWNRHLLPCPRARSRGLASVRGGGALPLTIGSRNSSPYPHRSSSPSLYPHACGRRGTTMRYPNAGLAAANCPPALPAHARVRPVEEVQAADDVCATPGRRDAASCREKPCSGTLPTRSGVQRHPDDNMAPAFAPPPYAGVQLQGYEVGCSTPACSGATASHLDQAIHLLLCPRTWGCNRHLHEGR